MSSAAVENSGYEQFSRDWINPKEWMSVRFSKRFSTTIYESEKGLEVDEDGDGLIALDRARELIKDFLTSLPELNECRIGENTNFSEYLIKLSQLGRKASNDLLAITAAKSPDAKKACIQARHVRVALQGQIAVHPTAVDPELVDAALASLDTAYETFCENQDFSIEYRINIAIRHDLIHLLTDTLKSYDGSTIVSFLKTYNRLSLFSFNEFLNENPQFKNTLEPYTQSLSDSISSKAI